MDLPAGYQERKLTETPRVPGEPRIYREKLYKDFKEKLNPGLVEAGYEALTDVRLATIFKGLTNTAVDQLYKDCAKARSFSKLFWWKFKQPKV